MFQTKYKFIWQHRVSSHVLNIYIILTQKGIKSNLFWTRYEDCIRYMLNTKQGLMSLWFLLNHIKQK